MTEPKLIYYPKLTDKVEVRSIVAMAEKGNIGAKLSLIMHNQAVLNKKLNKLLEEKND